MTRVYSLSTSTGKVMESGKTDWSTAEGGRRDRHKQTEPHTKRLEPCSSIWPGQIRLQHSGIYQVPQYRCITWTAERSPSHLLIAYSICASVCVCVCVCVSLSFLTLLCSFSHLFLSAREHVCLCATALAGDPPQGQGSSCRSPADLSGYFWSLADK